MNKAEEMITRNKYGINKNHIFNLILIIGIILAQISEQINIQFIKYISAFIIILLAFFCKKDFLLPILCFMIPANKLLTINEISVNTLVAVAICVRIIFIRGIINKRLFILIIPILCYSLQYIIRYNSIMPAFITLKTVIQVYALILIFVDSKIHIVDIIKRSVWALGLGIVIVSLSGIILNSNISSATRFAVSDTSNANNLGITCTFYLAMLMLLYIKNIKRFQLIDFMLAFLVLTIGVYTQSRSFLIGLAIVFIMWTLFAPKRKQAKKTIFILFALLLGSITVWFLITHTNSDLSQTIISAWNRIINPRQGDITGGRIDIWPEYINIFIKEPLVFWLGSGTYTNLGLTMMAHNAIIEIIADFGIIGLLMFTFYYIKALSIVCKNCIGGKKKEWINFTPLFVYVACSMFTHSYLSLNMTLMLFLSIILIKLNLRLNEY